MSAEVVDRRYFVDTNIIGALATKDHPHRVGYEQLLASDEFAPMIPSMSPVVAGEITAGLRTLDAGTPQQRSIADLVRGVLAMFDEVDEDRLTQRTAEWLRTEAHAAGHPIGADSQSSDLRIAALAIRHRAPLVSHNYRDFVNIDALDLRTHATLARRPPQITNVPPFI